MPKTGRRRVWLRRTLGAVFVAFVLASVMMAIDGWASFGKRPAGERLERIQASPQWNGRKFVNPEPLWNDMLGAVSSWTRSRGDIKVPAEPVPVVTVDPAMFDQPPVSGLRVTWFGHSSLLIEIDGRRVLIDPIWSDRVSPFSWAGVRRWYEPTLALDQLPSLDAVLISHDHYDHLDRPTIEALRDRDLRFIVPLGVGAHLAYWGVPEERIVELDWWEETALPGLDIVCTPARHASGRSPVDNNKTLWAGYVLRSDDHRVYYSGDTGLFPGLREIGERLGPFDLSMIEAGAYDQAWPDWHIGPEQAVLANQWVGGELLLPVHWGLFNLSTHGWTEPAERVLAAAERRGVRVVLPRPGESFEPATAPAAERWWPEIPWKSAAQRPIVSTGVDLPTGS
jgi:L-ascorbate metabolism protein UlaG (beta-lactamase superfamily)